MFLKRANKTDKLQSWLTDKSFPPHPPTPSPTWGEGELDLERELKSASLALGEGFGVRVTEFCQSTKLQRIPNH